MFFGADEHPAQCYGRSGMTEFVQGVTMQHVECVARFHDDQFTGSRNAKEPSLDPHGRTEEVAADAFLVADDAGRALQASQNPGVAP